MANNKNYVSETMFVSRVVSKGKIASVPTGGFHLKDHAPFTLYIRPKTLTTLERDVVINCKLYKDEGFGDVPVSLFCWNELVITDLAESVGDLLATYDLYWGSGDYAINV